MSGKPTRAFNFPLDEPVAGIGVWGDAAPMNTNDGLFVLLWNILAGVHHQWYPFDALSKFICCDCGCKGRYALGILKAGIYPTRRGDGVPFCGLR